MQDLGIFNLNISISNTIKVPDSEKDKMASFFKIKEFDRAYKVSSSEGEDSFLEIHGIKSFMSDWLSLDYQVDDSEYFQSLLNIDPKESKRRYIIDELYKIKRSDVSSSEKIEKVIDVIRLYSFEYHLDQFKKVMDAIFEYSLSKNEIDLRRKLTSIPVDDRERNKQGYQELLLELQKI